MSDSNPHDAFNDSAGIIDETIVGPYLYKGRVRILGFAAKPTALGKFLDGYLQKQLKGSGFNFTLANDTAPVVYMLINDFDETIGDKRKGIYRHRSCQFHIPVICTGLDGLSEKGSLQVFSFGSNMQTVLTSTEVRGPYMSHSGMHMKSWIEHLESNAPAQTLFTVSPQVLGPEEEVMNQCVLSLEKLEEPIDGSRDKIDIDIDGELEHITTMFAFKQFRHEKWRNKACYQSLVKITHQLVETPSDPTKCWDALVHTSNVPVTTRWLRGDGNDKLELLRARIRSYPYHPIVDALGLIRESLDSEEITTADPSVSKAKKTIRVDTIKPLLYLVIDSDKERNSPISFLEPLGETLCYRSTMKEGQSGWQPESSPDN
jgi:hypothetical protein